MKAVVFLILIFTILSCNTQKEVPITDDEATHYVELGNAISQKTFESLSSHLGRAMASGGIDSALQYCNIKALDITDSLSIAYNAEIKRTSSRIRNPQNKPDMLERSVLDIFEKVDNLGQRIEPKVLVDKSQIRYFAPIMVKPQCLACHGEIGASLSFENNDRIKAFYPKDEAVNYKENDLRGMWSISFDLPASSN